jgi:Fe-S cluster assembly ATP-binding protein
VSELQIRGLRAAAGDTEIVHGVDLTVRSGEVHVIMGPNGSGKSTLAHVLMGRPGYTVLGGSVTLDGVDLLGLEPWQRAQAGLYLALQYPAEVPGVQLRDVLDAAISARGEDPREIESLMAVEAERIGFDRHIFERALNVDLSGGEKKRNETLQLAVLRPRIAVLDELDSGLDIDALRACARRVEALTNEDRLGVLAITHYNRLLRELRADHIHILVGGRIVTSGGPEVATELEAHGYARFVDGATESNGSDAGADDPFADPLN